MENIPTFADFVNEKFTFKNSEQIKYISAIVLSIAKEFNLQNNITVESDKKLSDVYLLIDKKADPNALGKFTNKLESDDNLDVINNGFKGDFTEFIINLDSNFIKELERIIK